MTSILRGFLTCIVDCSRHDVCKNLGAHNPCASLLHLPDFQDLLFTLLSSLVVHWPSTEIIFLLFNTGLFHMMPKWWIEQGQPVEIFEQGYLLKGSQVVCVNANTRNPRSHDRRCSLVGGPRRTDRLTDGDFSNHWFQFIHCQAHHYYSSPASAASVALSKIQVKC